MNAANQAAICAFAALVLVSSTFAAEAPATSPSTTRATTKPATTQTTKPATKPDPLARPISAVEFLFQAVKAENFVDIHEVNLDSDVISDLRKQYAAAIKSFRNGDTIQVLDSHQERTVASVICRLSNKAGVTQSVFALLTIQRFDRWKVIFGKPNMRILTPGEKAGLEKCAEWNTGRLAALRALPTGAATQPSR